MNEYTDLLESQKRYMRDAEFLDLNSRISALKKLKSAIVEHESELISALEHDLGKHIFESYLSEVGFVYDSINYAIKNLKKWMKPKKVRNDLAQFLGKSMVYPSHYGSVLIIGSYNYPFQLTIEPLVGAISGGNTAVLKPSEYAAKTESVIENIISSSFDESYIAVVKGDYKVNSALLDLEFDYIFFTGSVNVGKIVMEKASKHLTPVTLELGGKSPAIVDKTADLKLAADRIIWGKLLNSGQTCVAPDYVLADRTVASELLIELKSAIVRFYGENAALSEDYGRIINRRHMERLSSMIQADSEKIVFGGSFDMVSNFIEPTLIWDASLDDSSMQEEIFGPILPIVLYDDFCDIEHAISKNPKPLSLYLFTSDDKLSERIISKFQFGGGCVNDTILHVASKHLPFGGVGQSGTGRYHGVHNFETFTYKKGIVKRKGKFGISIASPPYGNKLRWIRKLWK